MFAIRQTSVQNFFKYYVMSTYDSEKTKSFYLELDVIIQIYHT